MIEDVRQIFQDFLAPELRAIVVRLDLMDKRFDSLETHFEGRFVTAEKIAEARHNELMTRFEMVHDQIRNVEQRSQSRDAELEKSIRALQDNFEISRRLERLEAQASKNPAAEQPTGAVPNN